jgi:NADH-quinone oxidoreductase subunit N
MLSAASIVIGNIAALAQTSVRRLLGYSAVAHAGYSLLGILAGGAEGFGATLFYTTVYGFTLVGAFSVLAAVEQHGMGEKIVDLAGLRAKSPIVAGCMAVFMLSLAGLPPLPGFFGKFYLFMAVLHQGQGVKLLWLVILALAGSLVSLYYYLMVVKAILVDEEGAAQWRVNIIERMSIGVLAGIVLGLGVFPGVLLEGIVNALR